MNFDPNLKAKLVYDGGSDVHIPEEMGTPGDNQMQGTVHEQVSELCGRVCYDSLGKGRSSADYHKHLVEVNHGSVYEHTHFTALLVPPGESPEDTHGESDFYRCLAIFLNRPGIIVEDQSLNTYRKISGNARIANRGIRVTLNYRHLLDWDKFNERCFSFGYADTWRGVLLTLAKTVAPQIVGHLDSKIEDPLHHCNGFKIVPPEEEHEKWITLFLSGSRGFSHEQVRHRFNISQRSTRYVDESESPWVAHPLVSQYLNDEKMPEVDRSYLVDRAKISVNEAQITYRAIIHALQPYLISKGVDKFTARKQARGAARGYLGNALLTEMMFSASVADWKGILKQRLNPAADAEIRVIYSAVLPELKKSRYGDCFAEFETIDSPDGIGTVLKG